MDEQEKRVQRIMKCTVCLCGLLILLKVGQEKLAGYERPELYALHETVAVLADMGKQLFLPVTTAKTEPESVTQAFMDGMAAFFGWTAADDTEVYVEDEYTRQELIEAGRGGSLSAIQKENESDRNDTGAGSDTQQSSQQDMSEHSNVENELSQQEEPVKNSTGNEKMPENREEKGISEEDTSEKTGAGQDTSEKSDTAETIQEEPADFQRIVAGREKLSAEEILKQYFVVDPVTEIDTGLLSYDVLTGMKFHVDKQAEGPQILIYHTHSQETFRNSVKGDPETAIVGVGTRLEELLTEKGYRVLHLTDTFDVFGEKTDRSRAYTVARKKLKEVLAEYPSIQILLDIHRDGVPDDKRLVTTIKGKKTAKLMFFNGLSYKKAEGKLARLENPYIQENLALSFQTEYLCDLQYPGLSRCIYLKAYRYNLDLLPGAMLIEVGAQTNTVEEAKNAMLPLAEVLGNIL